VIDCRFSDVKENTSNEKAFSGLDRCFRFGHESGSQGEVAADGDNGIPLKALAGNGADTLHGSYALCLDPTSNFAEISCASTKAQVFPQTTEQVGNDTTDKKGNRCETYTETDTDLPPDLSPPMVAVLFLPSKVTSYDPATGAGDATFTSYLSGKCVGATFMGSTSVTNVNSTGTFHFVASNGGKRVDLIATSVTDPVGGVGDFYFVGTGLRQ
jgi:hypothetical protein